MDIFFVFAEANKNYELLQRENHRVDLSVPGLSSSAQEDAIALNVVVTTPKGAGKTISVADDAPFRQYQRLNKVLKGPVRNVEKQLGYFVGALKKLQVTFYQEFSSHLQRLFTVPGPGLLARFAGAFAGVVKEYFQAPCPLEALEVKVKLDYPASISCYYQEKNCGAIFRFTGRRLVLSGFPKPEIVDPSPVSKVVKPDVVAVQEGVITETATKILLHLPSSMRAVSLVEEVNPFLETTDEIVDGIVQKLVIMDALDALQDIILDDNIIYLCFDPCVEQDEMDVIMTMVKQAYPQALLASKPDGKDSPWWVVQISRVTGIAAQVVGAPVSDDTAPAMGKDGVIAQAAAEPIGNIVKNISVDQVITSVGKG